MPAESAGRVKGVRFASRPDHTRVVVDLEALTPYQQGRLSGPDRLYFDFTGTAGPEGGGTRQIPVGDGLIHQIRIGAPPTGGTRVVLDLEAPAEPRIFTLTNPPRLVVDLKPATPAVRAPAPEPYVPAQRPPLPPFRLPETVPPAPLPPVPPPAVALVRPPPLAPAPASAPPILPTKPAETGRRVRIPRVSRPPKLEDFLNGVSREAEAVITDFRQRSPGDGPPISQPTGAYLSYDRENIYAIFVCRDDPERVRARMAKREDISDDDRVAVYLDTFHDRQRAYVFASNPLGVQQDSVTTEGQSADLRFDTLWHSAGRLTADGYVVWMSIPFKSLRFSGDPEQVWGVALARSIYRNNELYLWPYITRRVPGFVQQMADLEVIEQVSPSRNLQFIPYGTFTHARLLDSGLPGYVTKRDWRGGLDTKVVLRNALSLDLTLNPDFSQVESDDPQVTINQRFEVFFPEKRPFFLENAGFFQTPMNLFFSRRIIDPEFGGRLTGKLGRWVVGALAADDRAPGSQRSAGDALAGEHAMNGAVRVQREFGSQSNFGVLAASRDFGPSWNRVFAIDTRLRLHPNWFLTAQAVRSYDRALDGTERQGPAYQAELSRSGRHFTYSGSFHDLSPDFRSRLGFIRRVDVRDTVHYVSYYWQPEKSRVLNFGPSFSTGANWDRHGKLQDLYSNLDFTMDFRGPFGFNVSRYEAYEFYVWDPQKPGNGFRRRTTGLSFYTSTVRWLTLSGSYYRGTGINYSPAAGLDPFLANSSISSFGVTLRPTPRFRLDEAYSFARLGTRRGSPEAGSGAPSIFNNHLFRTRLNYQFTRALSVRTIVDYYGTLTNPTLIRDDTFKRLSGDILVTYLLNPGTALYFGYTDRFDNVALDYSLNPALRSSRSPGTSTGRQFFIKISYLLRY